MNANTMNKLMVKSAIGLFSALLTASVAIAQPPAPPGGGGGSSTPSDCTAAALTLSGQDLTSSGKTYTAPVTSDSSDLNCGVYATADSKATLNNVTITSDQTGGAGGSGVEANYSSVVVLNNAKINVDAVNGLYAHSYGTKCYTTSSVENSSALPCSWITLNNGTITATDENAHGIDAMYLGRIDLNNVSITTTGDHAAGAVVNDTGDGIINASNVTATTAGAGSSGLYEIGSGSVFTINNSKFTAELSDGAADVVGGVMNLTNTVVSGYKEGLLIDGTATINGGAIIGTGTGTDGEAAYDSNNPQDTSTWFYFPAGNAINIMPFGAPAVFPATVTVENGAKLIPASSSSYLVYETSEQSPCTSCVTGVFNAIKEVLNGNIYLVADGGSTLAVNLSYSTLVGAVTNAAVSLDAHSKWTVNGNSVLTSLTIPGKSTAALSSYIVSTGAHTITYVKADNSWLGGKTYTLTGGATLEPAE